MRHKIRVIQCPCNLPDMKKYVGQPEWCLLLLDFLKIMTKVTVYLH